MQHPTDGTRLVTFRFQGAGEVEVRGDFRNFFHPVPLRPVGGGWQEAALRLPVGIYSYKFRSDDDRWHLDPLNPRTRASGGLRNSLLSVGGTDEPVLHAPARPLLYAEFDGRVCVRAGLRRGAGERLSVRWFEDTAQEVPMRLVAEEDEHLLFEAHLPASARHLEYLFVLPDRGLVGAPGGAAQAFRLPRRALATELPAWWRDAAVYTVFVDRFRRGGQGGRWGPPPPAPDLPTHLRPPTEEARLGGDLLGVREALPYLAELGVTALHLTPVGLSPSAHRYDAVDPRVVDPALGGEEALAALLADAHRQGLRVLLDLALTHVHRDFFAFRDVRERGPASPYAPWFLLRRFPFLEGPDPGYEHYQKGRWPEPLLNLDEEEVAAYWEETLRRYAQLGVDGFRVDAAADLPPVLITRLRRAVAAIRPDVVLFGEVIPDCGPTLLRAGLHAFTDFGVQGALLDWLWRRGDAAGAAAALARRRFWRGGPGPCAIGFTATHDQHRLLSRCGDARVARLAQLVVLCGAEVPALYYGDEVGLRCAEAGRDFEGAWPDRQPMPWDRAAWDQETLALCRAALALRREVAALRRGEEEVHALGPVLVLRRRAGDEIVELYANGAEGCAAAALLTGAPSGAEVLLQLGDAALAEGAVRLGSYGALLLRRRMPAALAGAWREVLERNRQLCAQSFVAGSLLTTGLPASLYLTVTEACNLRCQHCITDAPARTAEGRARTMQPWLLEALAEALGAADYFAFAHGGEPLTAPLLWDLLATIRAARAGRRYDVHLLTNGVLLDEAIMRRLIALGVTSLAVSIDGASAGVNDRIRIGGRFERIVANVRRAAQLRRELGADLRIGISTVVAADNVAEMEALGRLAADLGVDWIKVEELYPVNAFGRHQALAAGEPRVRQGLNTLRRAVEPRGLVVVDHLCPPEGCPCLADRVPGLGAFRAADDFANRARFHPCSMAWEQACIDPDGAVHPVDYGHPAIGTLAEAPLPALWNGEAMQRLRAEALRRVPAALRLGCPRGR